MFQVFLEKYSENYIWDACSNSGVIFRTNIDGFCFWNPRRNCINKKINQSNLWAFSSLEMLGKQIEPRLVLFFILHTVRINVLILKSLKQKCAEVVWNDRFCVIFVNELLWWLIHGQNQIFLSCLKPQMEPKLGLP